MEMTDGMLVMSYHQKNQSGGARGMVSFNQGKSWDSRVYMLGWPGGGHTSSVALEDGTILTVRGVKKLKGIEATIWRPLPPAK